MNQWERAASPVIARPTEQLSLYDRYGSMAYGIILQILPQPIQAQEALIALFSSAELLAYAGSSSNMAMAIIRLARQKALETKTRLGNTLSQSANTDAASKTNLPELVFDLTFRQGYSIEAITEKLSLPRKDVLKAIRDYSVTIRQA